MKDALLIILLIVVLGLCILFWPFIELFFWVTVNKIVYGRSGLW
jgi:hypothetical protein